VLINIHFISLIFHLTVIYSFKDVLGMCYDYIFATFYQICCISCKQHYVCVVIIEINTVQSFGWQREHIDLSLLSSQYLYSFFILFMHDVVLNSHYGLNLYCS